MRYESKHLFFAVVLNTVTPTIPEAKSQGTVLNRAFRVLPLPRTQVRNATDRNDVGRPFSTFVLPNIHCGCYNG